MILTYSSGSPSVRARQKAAMSRAFSFHRRSVVAIKGMDMSGVMRFRPYTLNKSNENEEHHHFQDFIERTDNIPRDATDALYKPS